MHIHTGTDIQLNACARSTLSLITHKNINPKTTRQQQVTQDNPKTTKTIQCNSVQFKNCVQCTWLPTSRFHLFVKQPDCLSIKTITETGGVRWDALVTFFWMGGDRTGNGRDDCCPLRCSLSFSYSVCYRLCVAVVILCQWFWQLSSQFSVTVYCLEQSRYQTTLWCILSKHFLWYSDRNLQEPWCSGQISWGASESTIAAALS